MLKNSYFLLRFIVPSPLLFVQTMQNLRCYRLQILEIPLFIFQVHTQHLDLFKL